MTHNKANGQLQLVIVSTPRTGSAAANADLCAFATVALRKIKEFSEAKSSVPVPLKPDTANAGTEQPNH